MIYKTQIDHIFAELQHRRDQLQGELKYLPEGMLYAEKRGGLYFYSQRIPKGGNHKKEHRVGITDDKDTIFALVRKKYILGALPAIEHDLKKLAACSSGYKPVDEASVMESYIKRYPQLSEGIYYDRLRQEEWAKNFDAPPGFYEENLRSVSGKGTRMRSAGEIYIASKLDSLKIPYRYEAPLEMPDLGYVPDFTILRPRDGKLFFWEHFGMTDSEEYIKNNMYKVSRYIDYGIEPWDNLIMTYNFRDGGLNAKLIDAMIDVWLL